MSRGAGAPCAGQGSSAAWIKRRSSRGHEREPAGAVRMPGRPVYPPKPFLTFAFGLKGLERRESNPRVAWASVTVSPSSRERGVLTLMLKWFRFQSVTKLAVSH